MLANPCKPAGEKGVSFASLGCSGMEISSPCDYMSNNCTHNVRFFSPIVAYFACIGVGFALSVLFTQGNATAPICGTTTVEFHVFYFVSIQPIYNRIVGSSYATNKFMRCGLLLSLHYWLLHLSLGLCQCIMKPPKKGCVEPQLAVV